MAALPTELLARPDLFDSLRAGFLHVAKAARHVSLREDGLDSYAWTLPDKMPSPVLDREHHFIGTEEETAAYILTLDSINFGSGYKPHLVAEGAALVEASIYYTLAVRLKERFEARGAFSADDLAAMTPQDVAAFIGLDFSGVQSRAFANLCVRALNETGAAVKAQGGRFMTLVNGAAGSAENMVRTLTCMNHFNDVHDYKGTPIAFYKRAQIAVADLHLAFRHFGRELFSDTSRLTMFADNAVPHVLNQDGILEYAPALERRIAAGEEIPSGAEEEIEIRACAAQAVELLAARKGMSAMEMDQILWYASREPRYRKTPTHRTLSWFY